MIKRDLMRYTEKVFSPYDSNNPKELKKGLKRIEEIASNSPSLYQYIKDLLVLRFSENKLPNGIEFLSNNVSEWVDMDYTNYETLLNTYINYNCFADANYCQYQRPIDINKITRNTDNGKLIMGTNWYDERYGNTFSINTEGIYPKRFVDKDSSYATVGFRLVLRLIDSSD